MTTTLLAKKTHPYPRFVLVYTVPYGKTHFGV